MRMHTLKTKPKYFKAQRSGAKTFEIRENDRDFKVGDILCLVEIDSRGHQTGPWLLCEVTYITDYAQLDAYVVLGTRLIEEVAP